MKRLTRREVYIVFGCVIFALANLGAVGANGRRRAKEAVCFSNELKWCGIWKSYVDDHDGYFPPGSAEEWGEPTMVAWPWVIRDYYRGLDAKMFLCPAGAKPVTEAGVYTFAPWCGESICGSYGVNLWVSSLAPDQEGEEYWQTPYVSQAASVPLMLDCWSSSIAPSPYDEAPPYEGGAPDFPHRSDMARVCINRHNGGVNGVFLDFSAKKVGLKGLWKLKWHRDWPEDYWEPVWPDWMADLRDY